ncbi:MAG: hypothetical protein MJ054_01585 [Clostridia bacterium]|nr:hypothetical protein [Clostridia bacterium]
MKLGKSSLLAIIEIALFTLGAVFFMLVLIIPSNPLWALVAGIFCGLAGAIIWSYSLISHLGHGIHKRLTKNRITSEDVARKILEDDNLEKNGYELHRSSSYNDYDKETLTDYTEQH